MHHAIMGVCTTKSLTQELKPHNVLDTRAPWNEHAQHDCSPLRVTPAPAILAVAASPCPRNRATGRHVYRKQGR